MLLNAIEKFKPSEEEFSEPEMKKIFEVVEILKKKIIAERE